MNIKYVIITFSLEGTDLIACLARLWNSPAGIKGRGMKGEKKE